MEKRRGWFIGTFPRAEVRERFYRVVQHEKHTDFHGKRLQCDALYKVQSRVRQKEYISWIYTCSNHTKCSSLLVKIPFQKLVLLSSVYVIQLRWIKYSKAKKLKVQTKKEQPIWKFNVYVHMYPKGLILLKKRRLHRPTSF